VEDGVWHPREHLKGSREIGLIQFRKNDRPPEAALRLSFRDS
jgi:hypothetical protein